MNHQQHNHQPYSPQVHPPVATLDAGGLTMTHIDWSEAAERYIARAKELEQKANLAFIAGLRIEACRLYDDAREYRDAAEDAEKKAMG